MTEKKNLGDYLKNGGFMFSEEIRQIYDFPWEFRGGGGPSAPEDSGNAPAARHQ